MTTTLAKLTLLVCLALALPSAATAVPAAAGERAKLQRSLDELVAAGAPGAIALVREGDRTIRVTSGFGNLKPRTPMRATDRFRIGSLTKTFVATSSSSSPARGSSRSTTRSSAGCLAWSRTAGTSPSVSCST